MCHSPLHWRDSHASILAKGIDVLILRPTFNVISDFRLSDFPIQKFYQNKDPTGPLFC